MLVTIVETALMIVGIYAVLGILAAIALHVKGLHILDSATRGSGWGFRVLVTPGLVALWPILIHKWRKAAAGGEVLPDPHRPIAPRALRTTQKVSWRAIALIAFVIAAFGVVNRPEVTVEARNDNIESLLADPKPLPTIVRELGALFGELPIEARLRGAQDAAGDRQLELTVAEDLAIPTLALYWCPPDSRTDSTPGAGAIFIGTVWGPGERRFPLSERVSGAGEWVLYSIARAETIAASPGTVSPDTVSPDTVSPDKMEGEER